MYKTEEGVNTLESTTDYTYDQANQLSTTYQTFEDDGQDDITTGNLYNGNGQRIRLTWNGSLYQKYYYMGSALFFTTDANNLRDSENILSPGGSIVASRRQDSSDANKYYFYHTDIRGSVTNIVGTKENAIYLAQGYNYDNFGKEEELKSESSFKNDVTFTGAVSDSMTGLYYMNARHYDLDTGRFLQQDTYKGSAAVPWTQHLYAYTGNNPVNMVDPTGHTATMYDQYPDSSYSGIYVPTVTKDNPYGDPRMAGPAPKSSMHDQYADAKNAGRSRPKSVNDASNQYVEPGMGGAYVAPIRNPSEAPLPYDPPALEFASEGIKIPKWVSDAEMIFAGVVGVGTLVYFGGVAVSGWFATHAGTVAATGGGGSVTTGLVKAAPKLANDFQIKFSEAALKHMMNPKRSVPIQILWEAIKTGNMGPDPKGSSAAKMFYSEMYRGNIKYNLEVLYDIQKNMIYHFEYTRDAIGNLPKIFK